MRRHHLPLAGLAILATLAAWWLYSVLPWVVDFWTAPIAAEAFARRYAADHGHDGEITFAAERQTGHYHFIFRSGSDRYDLTVTRVAGEWTVAQEREGLP